jgi:hypothetical protein
VVPRSARPPALRTLSVRPSAGALQRPVLSDLGDEDAENAARPEFGSRS